MTLDLVEMILDQGGRVGFNKPTCDPQYIGWILVKKVKANLRLLEVLDESEAPELVREEKRRIEQPYMVLNIELRRSVHESGDYETESDYKLKERYWFRSLEEVERQLGAWGYSLRDARNAREIDAP